MSRKKFKNFYSLFFIEFPGLSMLLMSKAVIDDFRLPDEKKDIKLGVRFTHTN